MNPFLNPYAALYAPASTQNAALYYFAAQQSMGGIGSGQMSGTRPRPGTGPRTVAGPIHIPDPRRPAGQRHARRGRGAILPTEHPGGWHPGRPLQPFRQLLFS